MSNNPRMTLQEALIALHKARQVSAEARALYESAYDQWLLVKQQYPDHIVMIQSGDFVNVFDGDADAAAPLLDCIVVTRHVGGRSLRVCGVPQHARLQYVQRLIDAGLRVALIEPERVISTR